MIAILIMFKKNLADALEKKREKPDGEFGIELHQAKIIAANDKLLDVRFHKTTFQKSKQF